MSRQVKSFVQKTLEINDVIDDEIRSFVDSHNVNVREFNDVIANIHNLDDEAVEQITPFIGSPKRFITETEMKNFLSDDYKLVKIQENTPEPIDDIVTSMEKASLNIKNTLESTAEINKVKGNEDELITTLNNIHKIETQLSDPYEEVNVNEIDEDEEIMGPVLIPVTKKEVKFADEYDIITFDKNEPIVKSS